MGYKPEFRPKDTNKTDYKYDALFVFGAVMRWNQDAGWHFPLIMEEHEYSGRLVLGHWRAMAAAVLKDIAPSILVSGGSNTHPNTGEKCSRAVELARYIVEYGAPSEKVFPMGTNDASHTLGNVANLSEYLKKNSSIKKIGMLCPRFQMPRAMVMQYNDPFYTENSIEMIWIEVEETLIKHNRVSRIEINRVYTSTEADICTQMEQRGLQDLLTGKYKPKT